VLFRYPRQVSFGPPFFFSTRITPNLQYITYGQFSFQSLLFNPILRKGHVTLAEQANPTRFSLKHDLRIIFLPPPHPSLALPFLAVFKGVLPSVSLIFARHQWYLFFVFPCGFLLPPAQQAVLSFLCFSKAQKIEVSFLVLVQIVETFRIHNIPLPRSLEFR